MPNTSTTATSAEAGPTFRALREGASLSVRALAERAGVHASTISRWERGEREVSETTYEHLTVTLAEFMAGRWAA